MIIEKNFGKNHSVRLNQIVLKCESEIFGVRGSDFRLALLLLVGSAISYIIPEWYLSLL